MADGNLAPTNAPACTPGKLRYHRRTSNNTRYPFNRLPFIDRKSQNCWNFPPSDGYGAGCEMGDAAADAFMKALRESQIDTGGQLQQIVLSLAASGLDLNDEGRKGQVVGFFSSLDAWLRHASKILGASLDDIRESDIAHRMTVAAMESEEAGAA